VASRDCHVPFAVPLEDAHLPIGPELVDAARDLMTYRWLAPSCQGVVHATPAARRCHS